MSYAGLDTDIYPKIMARLIAETNFRWTGYYLKGPSHPDRSWLGHRAELQAAGWGLAPVYVGQEIVGPGSHIDTRAQGAVDGAAAANEMESEGFAPGSCVYLDLENGPPFTGPEQDYVEAWCAVVRQRGWLPGVYCGHLIAAMVVNLVPDARIWAVRLAGTGATNTTPFPTPDPSLSGYPKAAAWQRVQNVALPNFGIVVDLSSAVMADPGAPNG